MLVADTPLTNFVKTPEKPKSGLDQIQTLAHSPLGPGPING